MKFLRQMFGVCFVAVCLIGTAWASQVSVSNYPLYLLSQEVTKGVGDAKVLLGTGDVGHHGSLSPSAMKLVKDSQFVVWFGGELEENLTRTLTNAPNAIRLFDVDSLNRYPLRDVDGKVMPNSFDPHVWLDPANAKVIVAALTTIHSRANPEHKSTYKANAKSFYKKMDALANRYRSAKPRPYWAYHDAYQYLEKPLNLVLKGTLTPDHHLSPKASRFRALADNRPAATMCLASQISVSDGIKSRLAPLNTVVRQEDMSDRSDFLGAWEDLAQALSQCVANSTAK